jgi:hypothetical protein
METAAELTVSGLSELKTGILGHFQPQFPTRMLKFTELRQRIKKMTVIPGQKKFKNSGISELE